MADPERRARDPRPRGARHRPGSLGSPVGGPRSSSFVAFTVGALIPLLRGSSDPATPRSIGSRRARCRRRASASASRSARLHRALAASRSGLRQLLDRRRRRRRLPSLVGSGSGRRCRLSRPRSRNRASSSPPGWYPTAYGWQWWDGVGSGTRRRRGASSGGRREDAAPYAEPPRADLRRLRAARLRDVPRRQGQAVRCGTTRCEALNFAITLTIIARPRRDRLVFFVGPAAPAWPGGDRGRRAIGIAAGPRACSLILAVSFGGIAFGIDRCGQGVSRMEWWRYPINTAAW